MGLYNAIRRMGTDKSTTVRFVELWERQRRGEDVIRELDDLYHDMRMDLSMSMADGISPGQGRW